MLVKARLLSVISKKVPSSARGRVELHLPQGSTIADVFAELDLPDSVLCSIDGKIIRDFTLQISENQEIKFFRPIGGG